MRQSWPDLRRAPLSVSGPTRPARHLANSVNRRRPTVGPPRDNRRPEREARSHSRLSKRSAATMVAAARDDPFPVPRQSPDQWPAFIDGIEIGPVAQFLSFRPCSGRQTRPQGARATLVAVACTALLLLESFL